MSVTPNHQGAHMSHRLPSHHGRHRRFYHPSKAYLAFQWIHTRQHRSQMGNGDQDNINSTFVQTLSQHRLAVQQWYQRCQISLESPKSKLSRITREAEEALANDPWITIYTVDNGKIHKRYVNPDLAYARVMGGMAEA